MKKRNFTAPSGATITFTELGFGAAPIGNLYRAVDPEDAQKTLEAAFTGQQGNKRLVAISAEAPALAGGKHYNGSIAIQPDHPLDDPEGFPKTVPNTTEDSYKTTLKDCQVAFTWRSGLPLSRGSDQAWRRPARAQ